MARILLADDDPLVVDLITFKLKKRGHQVESIADGELILDSLKTHPPDLLILDYQLPAVSTGEILAFIKNNPATAQLPIIVLSSAWREQDVLETLQAGINDFMTKPFSPDELILRINLALSKATKTIGNPA